jgi:ankyrin repeat protein
LTLVSLSANLNQTHNIMKTIFPKSYLIPFIVLILSSGYTMSQEGSDLITAVAYQDLDKIKDLDESGVDINYQEESAGVTALIMSAMYNFGDIASYLIGKGADISIRNKTGHTALMAAAGSSEKVFDLLAASGADMNVKLEDGSNVNAMAANGNTPLSLAEEEKDQEMIALLKQLGAK